MKRVVFTLTLVVAIWVCAVVTISAREKEKEARFTFQTIIFPGDTFTQLLGINDFEVIEGYHGSGGCRACEQGVRLHLPKHFHSGEFPQFRAIAGDWNQQP